MTRLFARGITIRSFATVGAAVAAGIQGLVILIISKRALSTEDFAPLAQLWAIWAVSAASLNYGFQQWSAVRPFGASTLFTAPGRRVVGPVLALCLLLASTSFVLREDLFSSGSAWWPALAGLLPLGTAAVGLNRGDLARTGRTWGLAFVIGAENTLRLIITIGLALVDAPAPLYGVALIMGFVVAGMPKPRERESSPVELRPLVAAVGSGMASHALLFGAPIILAVGGGTDQEVVGLFLVLSAVRAPFVLLQGLIPQIAVRFGRDTDSLDSTVRALLTVAVISAVAAFALGITLGDLIVGKVFSIQGELSNAVYGMVGATAMISVSLTVVTVRLVAGSRLRLLLLAWSAPMTLTLVALVAGRLANVGTVAAWILCGHLLVAMIVLASTRTRIDDPQVPADRSLS